MTFPRGHVLASPVGYIKPVLIEFFDDECSMMREEEVMI
jgi:hypothetical protein